MAVQLKVTRKSFQEQLNELMGRLLILFDEGNRKLLRDRDCFVQYSKDQITKQLDWATKSTVDHFDPSGQSIRSTAMLCFRVKAIHFDFDLSEYKATLMERYTTVQIMMDAVSYSNGRNAFIGYWWICNCRLRKFTITTNNQHVPSPRNNSRNRDRSSLDWFFLY